MGASLLAVAKSIYYEICIQYIVVGVIIKTFMSQKRILNGDLSYLPKRTGKTCFKFTLNRFL